jgi:hypothetical protein
MTRAKPPSTRRARATGAVRPAAGGERAPFTIDARWATLVLLVLVLAFFHEVAIEGLTFVSPDTVSPAGFVRAGERALFQERVYPLWNPYVFLGMPSFASGAYNPFIYPPDWPLALIARVLPLPDMTWLLIYYVLGGLFMFLLAREWGARPEGALLAGVAFVFAPNLVAVGSHGHGSQLVDSAYVPLILWLATRWMRRGGIHHLGWLAIAGGFQLLRGHVQICFYTWLAVALYLLVELGAGLMKGADPPPARRVGRAAAVGAAMALAFGIAAFYSLPLRDYAAHSIRGGGAGGGVGMDYATAWSLAPWELPTAVVPGAVGFGGQTYWGGMPFTDYPNIHVGIVTVLAAVPAVLTRGAPQAFALVLAVVSILVAMGSYFPLYKFLYDHLPLFNKFRVPVMIVVLFQVAVALGLAWGWTRVLEEGRARAPSRATGRLLLGLAIALALGLVVGVMGQGAWHDAYVRLATSKKAGFPPEAAEYAFRMAVTDLGRTSVIGLLALGLVLLLRRGRLPALVGTLGLLVLLLVDLWPVSRGVMRPVIGPRTETTIEAERDEVIAFLEQAGPRGTFRILPFTDFQTNRYAGFEIATLGGMHAAKPKLFQDFMDSRARFSLPWFRLLNIRYLIIDQPLDNPGMRLVHRVASQMPGQPDALIYENDFALPRATVVGQVRVAPAAAILDTIATGLVDPATTVWMERDPGLELGPVEGATATIAEAKLNRVVVDVTTPGPGLLRLADLWYPDWKATVDGRPAEVLRVDYLLRAVPVPAGSHRVVFTFEPRSMRLGLIVSVVSLLLALALILAGWWLGRRPARVPGPADERARDVA